MAYLKNVAWSLFSSFVAFAGVYGLLSYAFGETNVTAVMDGEPLKGAAVYINDEKVGLTPYTEHLGFGEFHVVVVPPKNAHAMQLMYQQDMYSVVLGFDISAPFTPIPAGMTLTGPEWQPKSKHATDGYWWDKHPIGVWGIGFLIYDGVMTGLFLGNLRRKWPEDQLIMKDLLTGGLFAAAFVPFLTVVAMAASAMLIAYGLR